MHNSWGGGEEVEDSSYKSDREEEESPDTKSTNGRATPDENDASNQCWEPYARIVRKQFNEELSNIDFDKNSLEARRFVRELNEAFLHAYECDLLRYEELMEDETTESLMETRKKCMSRDNMGEEEALKAAIDRRKHLILKHAPNWFDESSDDDDDRGHDDDHDHMETAAENLQADEVSE